MTKGVDSNACNEVEISRTAFGEEVWTLSLLENFFRWPVDRHDVLARIAHDNSHAFAKSDLVNAWPRRLTKSTHGLAAAPFRNGLE